MKNADMPAMPVSVDDETHYFDIGKQSYATGLTKREHFAAMAMQGMVSNSEVMMGLIKMHNKNESDVNEHVKKIAFGLADKMLEEKQS